MAELPRHPVSLSTSFENSKNRLDKERKNITIKFDKSKLLITAKEGSTPESSYAPEEEKLSRITKPLEANPLKGNLGEANDLLKRRWKASQQVWLRVVGPRYGKLLLYIG